MIRPLLAALLAGCAGAPADPVVLDATTSAGLYDLTLAFEGEVVVGPAEAELAVEDPTDGPVEGAVVRIEPYMPLHGHGVSEEPAVEELGEGRYAAGWVFPMAGTWEVTVTVEGEAGADEAVIDVDVR